MKRRLTIAATMFALYAVLMTVAWLVGTRKAEESTNAQLDYAVIDLHDTVAGAIDTMLGHVARTAVRHIGGAKPMSRERMEAGAKELDIDEVNVVDGSGRIIASNDPHCLGVMMAGDPVMEPFMDLTNGVTATVSQPFRPHARNPAVRAKYLGAAFPGGAGFVQVGLDERRLSRMLPSILGYIFDEWLLGRTGFFLCAEAATGRLISNPSRHRDEARTLAEAGYDAAVAMRYEITADGRHYGTTFVQRLFGEKCYCRAFLFGGHRFVAALPEREFYSARDAYGIVFGTLLFVVLAVFAWFIDRVSNDSARLRAFYAAEEARRAKDLLLAETIQTAALPSAPPDSHYFRLAATMAPARSVGGDFYDHFQLDATHYAFLVADVSGKGITAALYMMTAKTLIKDSLLAFRTPAAALEAVNAELCRNNPANMFLTAWVGVLNMETGEVSFANAGHNPPAAFRDGKWTYVPAMSGPALALMDGISFVQRQITLKEGDALFLYTDGVTEAQDQSKELFGEERLANALAAVNPPEPSSLCNVVRAAVTAFEAGETQADDITVLAMRRLAAPRIFSRAFPPAVESIAVATEFLDEQLAANDCPQPLLPVLNVILDEVCSNIIKHSGASTFEVDVEFLPNPPSVKLTFTDDGVAYNPLSHEDPDTTLSADERPIGGLGILMVKKMSTSVSYVRKHGRNFLSVVKDFA